MASGKKKSNASGTSTEGKRTGRRPTRFAICIQNSGYPASLELHKIYRVVPDEEATQDGDIRVIDESGEDYLYPADWFVAVEIPRAAEKSLLRTSK